MPLLKNNALIGLPVVTENGQRLGTVRAFDIDIESQTIFRYWVKQSGLSIFGRDEFFIHARQVVSISKKQMTVRDSTVKDSEEEQRALTLGKDAIPILSRDLRSSRKESFASDNHS